MMVVHPFREFLLAQLRGKEKQNHRKLTMDQSTDKVAVVGISTVRQIQSEKRGGRERERIIRKSDEKYQRNHGVVL